MQIKVTSTHIHTKLSEAFRKGISSGNMELVDWFIPRSLIGLRDIMEAVEHGHVDVLTRLIRVAAGEVFDEDARSECMQRAIEKGRTDVVKCLQSMGADLLLSGIPTVWAVTSGKLEMLKYVISHGARCCDETVGTVGFNGKVEFLEYMKNNPGVFRVESSVNTGSDLLSNSVGNGHYDVLEWGVENGYSLDHALCEQAAAKGDLEMVKRLRGHGCPFGNTCGVAKKGGHIKLYMWAKLNGST